MRRSVRVLWAASTAVLMVTCPGPALAGALSVDYAISLAGLPLGTATLSTGVEGERYRLSVQARLTGLVGAVTGGKGGATASGTLTAGKLLPAGFDVTTRSSSAHVIIRMGMAAGAVSSVDIDPPAEPKPDRVPLLPSHKRGVVDPASALLMPVAARGDPADGANCNRTLPVFDGWTRFDIVLTFADKKTIDQAGYKGPVLVCHARYVPIAGHRAERPATKFMQENRTMSVWLAPAEGGRVMVPFRISVGTMLGTNVIEATRWSAEGTAAAPSTAAAARSR